MNDDMTAKLEAKLVARDREANKGEYEPYADAIFIATDTGRVFDGNGSEWVRATRKYETVAFESGVGDVLDVVHGRTAETPVWNVEAHGIDGDGTTEVGGDVHDLLETVDEAGGGVVYFPPGRYLLERTPLIGDDTLLLGAGRSTVFEGPRPDGDEGRALFSNRGYDETGYDGASNWGIRNVRIDAPEANGVLPAHAANVRLENIYGDRIYYHHIDIVSSKNVVVDGYWATRGGEHEIDAPFQLDNQNEGTEANGIQDGDRYARVEDDGTPTRNCTLTNFEIDPENGAEYGVHIHRDGNESITIEDGYITGCRDSAIRADTGGLLEDLTVDGVSCIDNARGISLGHIESGRRELTISNVTIRTDDEGLAAGSGLYASGFDGAELSNLSVDGAFTNAILFDDMDDLKMSNVTASGADNQAFRFRENVDVTLTTARAADCGTVGIYAGPDSSVAYGGVAFDGVGTRTATGDPDDDTDGDVGEFRAWTTSPPSS
ncbi:hypothetical protein GS429_02735 [Natronorubrum sp. JWXQ-INN-674]|uniref:Rhamnogalacturonase A/B/Epimerase-like pectate lyase domain-containing protein n=2 Tax=Natronorubrum halalkaliphilum TaxID=2691917 RepID=A0A6B0VGQ1_9EURY|nr:glycosyl hydrolase family 28-related protein [Natronorubrum halalkaliphilum]MXV60991.1 hypothetical protein [Natronorubrum halalkaliphilum]